MYRSRMNQDVKIDRNQIYIVPGSETGPADLACPLRNLQLR